MAVVHPKAPKPVAFYNAAQVEARTGRASVSADDTVKLVFVTETMRYLHTIGVPQVGSHTC